MTKLCQITALLTGKKNQTQKAITEVYHRLQKPALFQGLIKRYISKDEDGETYPDERQNVQFKVNDCLQEVRTALSALWDLTATQDVTNCVAKADVVVDGRRVLEQVPVTNLLFLEKQLTDLHTLLTTVPTLDPQEIWAYDGNAGSHVSEKVYTNKTKKTPRNHVKAEATKEHPAQVEMYYEDVIVGKWETLKFSAAWSADAKNAVLARLVKLQDAVKLAREEANAIEAKDLKIGEKIFDFILDRKS